MTTYLVPQLLFAAEPGQRKTLDTLLRHTTMDDRELGWQTCTPCSQAPLKQIFKGGSAPLLPVLRGAAAPRAPPPPLPTPVSKIQTVSFMNGYIAVVFMSFLWVAVPSS